MFNFIMEEDNLEQKCFKLSIWNIKINITRNLQVAYNLKKLLTFGLNIIILKL